ncbi:hypothetical protein F2Q70_00002340 [Brassica cretica]|uniref:Uncharacterized protein n=1 Tax=Brassica cretica TaxID=69181 RepID=A0A8S9J1M7_BRACR|nr:hypothetical protein F2Q70_00002340 [Brassica cretica]
MLQGISLSPAVEKHSGLTTDVCSQNCCSCLDLICDRGVRNKGSRKFVSGKRHPPIPCFLYLGNIRCDVYLAEHDLLQKDILVFFRDLDVNFVVTVFDPNNGLSDIDSVVTDFDSNRRDKIGAAPYDGCLRTLVEGIKPFVVRLGVKVYMTSFPARPLRTGFYVEVIKRVPADGILYGCRSFILIPYRFKVRNRLSAYTTSLLSLCRMYESHLYKMARLCFEKMLVRMTVWSSKKVFLSRKEFSSKNESQASVTSRDAEDLLFFRMSCFVPEMFAGLKMFRDTVRV